MSVLELDTIHGHRRLRTVDQSHTAGRQDHQMSLAELRDEIRWSIDNGAYTACVRICIGGQDHYAENNCYFHADVLVFSSMVFGGAALRAAMLSDGRFPAGGPRCELLRYSRHPHIPPGSPIRPSAPRHLRPETTRR